VSAGTIVGLFIALGTLMGTYVLGIRRFKHERGLADLDAVRRVLDDAAIELHNAEYTLAEIGLGLSEHADAYFDHEKPAMAFDDLEKIGKRLDMLAERLRIRFGRVHAIVVAFDDARSAALIVYRAVQRIKDESMNPPAPETTAATEFKEMFYRERSQVNKARHDSSTNAQSSLMRRSASLVSSSQIPISQCPECDAISTTNRASTGATLWSCGPRTARGGGGRTIACRRLPRLSVMSPEDPKEAERHRETRRQSTWARRVIDPVRRAWVERWETIHADQPRMLHHYTGPVGLESFVDTFKTELIADRVWRSRTQMELAAVEYIAWFNNDRIHESLGDISPAEFEDLYVVQEDQLISLP